MKIFISLILAMFMLATTAQAEYRKPDITTLMFKIDKLTLDRDHVTSLSRTLTTVAQRNTDKDRQLEANAMFLAIALRLNPKNEQAIFVNQRFINELDVPDVEKQQYDKAVRRLVNVTKFLARAEPGTEAQKLCLYLKDALSTMDPKNEAVKGHNVDAKRWQHVIRPAKKN